MGSKFTLFLTTAVAAVFFLGMSAPAMAEDPPSGDQGSKQEGKAVKKKKKVATSQPTSQPTTQPAIKIEIRIVTSTGYIAIFVPVGKCVEISTVEPTEGSWIRVTSYDSETGEYTTVWYRIKDCSGDGADEGEGDDGSQGDKPTTQPADKEKKKPTTTQPAK